MIDTQGTDDAKGRALLKANCSFSNRFNDCLNHCGDKNWALAMRYTIKAIPIIVALAFLLGSIVGTLHLLGVHTNVLHLFNTCVDSLWGSFIMSIGGGVGFIATAIWLWKHRQKPVTNIILPEFKRTVWSFHDKPL